MRSIFRLPWRLALPGTGLTLLLYGAAPAAVIKVYDPRGGSDFAAMKEAAAILAGRLEADRDGFLGASPEDVNGFSYQVDPGIRVPREFSPAAGSSAYIWSEYTLKFESGFDFRSAPVRFGKKAEAEALAKPASLAQPIWTTGLQRAVLKGTSLRLDYSLAQGGPVTLEVFGTNGRTHQRWTWREAEIGRHTKTFEVAGIPRSGALFIRWSHGKTRMSQRVTVVR